MAAAAANIQPWTLCCNGDTVQIVDGAKEGKAKTRCIRFTDDGKAIHCETLGRWRKKPVEWQTSSFRDVVEGPFSPTFIKYPQYARPECFSIALDNQAMLDIVCGEATVQKRWIAALRALLGKAAPAPPLMPRAPSAQPPPPAFTPAPSLAPAASVPSGPPPELAALHNAGSGRLVAQGSISIPMADMTKPDVRALRKLWDEATGGAASTLTAAEAARVLSKHGLPASREYVEYACMEGKRDALAVTVISGRGLAPKDGKTSDPYVRAEIGNQKKETGRRDKTLEPSWDETLTFDITGMGPSEVLRLAVYDHDMITGDDYMGEAALTLGDVLTRGSHAMWFPLGLGQGKSAKVSGDICVRFELVDSRGRPTDRSAPVSLTWDEFAHVSRKLIRRPEIVELFTKHGGANGFISQDELRMFLQGVQHEGGSAGAEAAAFLIAKHGTEAPTGGKALTVVGFASVLLDPRPVGNGAVGRQQAVHDMDQPLHCYYINAASILFPEAPPREAALEAYREALHSGVRCLSIEVFTGPGGPVVYPSTSSREAIPLPAVLETIAADAFETSPFPLILALDLRLTVAQAEGLGGLLRDAFGEALCRDPRGSPRSLERRVLVMTRPFDIPEADFELDSPHLGDPDARYRGLGGETSPPNSPGTSPRRPFGEVYYPEDEAGDLRDAARSFPLLFTRGLAALAPPTARSGPLPAADWVALRCVPFSRTLDGLSGRADGAEDRVATIGMGRLLSAAARRGSEVASLASRQLVCVRGLEGRCRGRGPASGSNALAAWAVGCQIVPLNFRAADDPAIAVARAKFAANSGCGYVLKPDGLRGARGEQGIQEALQSAFATAGPARAALSLKVLGTGQLPLRRAVDGAVGTPPDAVLGVDVVGSPLDANLNTPRVQPRVIEHAGVAARFDQPAEFELAHPPSAFVRFLLWDGTPSNLLACGALPAVDLRPGVRAVALYSAHDGEPLPGSTMLVHIAAQ